MPIRCCSGLIRRNPLTGIGRLHVVSALCSFQPSVVRSAGNILMHPLMGVLIVDYEHGARTLQMTGRAEIVDDSMGMPGAQRVFKFSIEEFVYVSRLLSQL